MATSKNEGAKVRYDAFIKNVRPDPGSTEQIVLMRGYVGEASNENNIRLYSDAGLADYMDIPKEDIVHSVPNADDALGGSQLWVKQSSNVLYSDPNAFTQGDMYNSYMNNNYTPGDYSGQALAATAICPGPALTRQVICRQSIFVICTRNVRCFITPRNQRTICRPCYVTPPITPQTPVTINPNPGGGGGGFNDPYGDYRGGETTGGYGDYTGGDLYNDYLTNSYDAGGGYGEFGPVAATSPQICLQPQASFAVLCQPSRIAICPSVRFICRTVNIIQCVTPKGIRTICKPCWVTPPVTPRTPVNPGGGGFGDPYGGFADAGAGGNAGYGDYTGGEMYNDYMANAYDGGTGYGEFGPGAATNLQVCLQPQASLAVACQPSIINICQTSPAFCPVRSVPVWRCPVQRTRWIVCDPPGCRTFTRIPPVSLRGCPSDFCTPRTPQTPVNPGGGGGFMEDPYAGGYGAYTGGDPNAGYGDYTGGEMYGDYMANEYAPEAGAGVNAAAATLVCQFTPRTPCCPVLTPRCPVTPRCQFTPRTPCCPVLTPRCPVSPRTPCCPVTPWCPTPRCPRTWCPTPTCPFTPGGGPIPGGPGGFEGGYNDPYGY